MTTLSLRGMVGQGPLHWRGDRTTPGDEFDVSSHFGEFSPAFVSLLGRGSEPAPADFDAFRDFVLTLVYPPNPIKALDDSETTSEAQGRTAFINAPTGGGAIACAPCHSLPTGTNGFTLDSNIVDVGSQGMKIPHLRNAYDKIGAYGVAGDQVSGFGFLHDGSDYSMFDFLSIPAFTFSGTQKTDIENFEMVIDTGFKPIVGQQVTVDPGNFSSPAIIDRIALMVGQADAGNTDLVVKGILLGEPRGFVYVGGGQFQSDRNGEPTLTTSDVRLLASVAGQEQVFTATPTGTGTRVGINRDGDSLLNGDDNCPGIANDPQTDTDSDGLGDPCDPTPLPEPGVATLAIAGALWLGALQRRRERRR